MNNFEQEEQKEQDKTKDKTKKTTEAGDISIVIDTGISFGRTKENSNL